MPLNLPLLHPNVNFQETLKFMSTSALEALQLPSFEHALKPEALAWRSISTYKKEWQASTVPCSVYPRVSNAFDMRMGRMSALVACVHGRTGPIGKAHGILSLCHLSVTSAVSKKPLSHRHAPCRPRSETS